VPCAYKAMQTYTYTNKPIFSVCVRVCKDDSCFLVVDRYKNIAFGHMYIIGNSICRRVIS